MRGIVRTIAAALALAAFAWLNTVAEAATAGSSASPVASQAPLSDLGIVLLHGKQGAGGRGNIASLAGALVAAGYRVESPDMCWARPRIYDAPFPECLREIDAAIAALHAAGARRIVVAGQSLGGMATLVYAANHPEVNGAMAFAPAGRPQSLAHNASVAASIAKAQQMLAAHQDAERAGFTDVNNGKTFPVTTTPAIFLSFAGPGAQTDFVAVLPASTTVRRTARANGSAWSRPTHCFGSWKCRPIIWKHPEPERRWRWSG